MLDIRNLNMLFTKSGFGSLTTRLCIPISWCYDMGLDLHNRAVVASYDCDKKEIVIKKK